MGAKRGIDLGKTRFVRDLLGREKGADEAAVNRAWKDAGHEGTISGSLVSKIRSELGLTRRRRRRRGVKAVAGAADRPAMGQANGRETLTGSAALGGSTHSGGRGRALDDLEIRFDRLLFRLMDLGGLTDVEDALRRARRLLILGAHRP